MSHDECWQQGEKSAACNYNIISALFSCLSPLSHCSIPHRRRCRSKGVPYASPPTGRLRFMPPRTPDVWTGIRNADRAGAVCPQNVMPISSTPHRPRHSPPALLSSFSSPQLMTEEILRNETELLKILTTPAAAARIKKLLANQSEDCLLLDIYSHAIEKSRETIPGRLPVLVFVPGGSFSSIIATSAYDGSLLSSYGKIVVVIINYRLGVLGESLLEEFGSAKCGAGHAAGQFSSFPAYLPAVIFAACKENWPTASPAPHLAPPNSSRSF